MQTTKIKYLLTHYITTCGLSTLTVPKWQLSINLKKNLLRSDNGVKAIDIQREIRAIYIQWEIRAIYIQWEIRAIYIRWDLLPYAFNDI